MAEGASSGQRVRLGIIGCGAIGRVHAERLLADPRANLVGLCDPQREAAERLERDLVPGASIFTELPELLDSCSLDASVVSTPTLFHFDQVRACRDRGVHVLCEKPLCDTRQRILQIIDEAARGPVVQVSYQRRFDATFRTLRREVRSGRWGPVQSVTSHTSERWQQTIGGTWRDDPRLNPGGFLGDAGSHKIDMLFYTTGLEPVEVFAHSDRRGSRVEIVTTISGLLAGGVALGMTFIGDAEHWREDLHIHCREADLAIREGGVWMGRQNRFEPIGELEPGSSPDAAFLDVLTRGGANEAPPPCALPVFDFTRAVLESSQTGRVVRVGTP